jgi:PAS domain S-box-containing protein
VNREPHSSLPTWIKIGLLSAAYLGLALVGRLLAIPPGYSSPVWPAAGLALGVLFIWGRSVWPGILLGSFVFNLIQDFSAHGGQSLVTTVCVAAMLGIGAAAQALLGHQLGRRFLIGPTPLARGKDVLFFFLFAGLIACASAPTIGVSTLWLLGRIATGGFVPQWLAWWSGDVIGVILFTPIVFLAMPESRRLWDGRSLSIVGPLIGTAFLLVLSFSLMNRARETDEKEAFDQSAAKVGDRVLREFLTQTKELGALERFVSATPELSHNSFKVFTTNGSKNFGVQGMRWIARVPLEERANFEAAASRELGAPFQINQLNDQNQIVQAGVRSEYFPTLYGAPVEADSPAIGFDCASEPARFATMVQARDTGLIRASKPVRLGQEGETGVFVFMAVYRPGFDALDASASEATRRLNLRGYALQVFNLRFFEKYLNDCALGPKLVLRVSDVTQGLPVQTIATTGPFPNLGSPGWTDDLDFGGRTWRLEVKPAADWLPPSSSLRNYIFHAIGMFSSLLIVSFILSSAGQNIISSHEVLTRTKELRASTDRLLERAAFQDALMTSADFIIATIDSGGIVQTINAAAQQKLGYAADEVIGKLTPMVWHDPSEITKRAEDLSREIGEHIEPGIESFIAKARLGMPDEHEWTCVRKDGRTFSVLLSITAISGGEGKIRGYLGIARDITEIQQARIERQEAQMRLQAILDNTDAVIFMKSLGGRYLLANRRWTDLFCPDGSSPVGRRDGDIFSQEMATAFRENDSKAIAAGHQIMIEEIAPHEDGPHTYLSVKFPVPDKDGKIKAVGGIATDITDRKRASDALRNSEARLRAVLDTAGDAIIIMDEHRMVQAFNSAAARMFGYEADEIIGQDVNLLMPEPERSKHDGYVDGDLQTGVKTIIGAEREVSARRKDGSVFPAELVVSESTVPGGRIFTGVLRDISRRKAAARELMRSNQELQQFAYVASHDLNEPLRAVTGFLQLLDQHLAGQVDKETRYYIDTAVDGARRMRSLIKGLLDYSRIGSHGTPLVPTNSAKVLEDTLKDLGVSIVESGAVITHDEMPEVIGDKVQLSQLFGNLIGNAIKYRSDHRPEIHIGAKLSDGMWHISVRDNGIGIKPEFFDRIFIIFQRLHLEKDISGAGLGLALCKRIVERHSGEIWVSAAPGKGATFHFTLKPVEGMNLKSAFVKTKMQTNVDTTR